MLAGLAVLAGCAGQEELGQVLPPTMLRAQLTGRTFTGLIGQQRFFITFNRDGTASYYGAETEYVHWRADDQGLCIEWYGAVGEKCAPVYLAGYASYRVGTITMRQIAVPRRDGWRAD